MQMWVNGLNRGKNRRDSLHHPQKLAHSQTSVDCSAAQQDFQEMKVILTVFRADLICLFFFLLLLLFFLCRLMGKAQHYRLHSNFVGCNITPILKVTYCILLEMLFTLQWPFWLSQLNRGSNLKNPNWAKLQYRNVKAVHPTLQSLEKHGVVMGSVATCK